MDSYTEHRDAMLDYWNTTGTDLAKFRNDVAQADLTWAESVRTGRNRLHQQLSADYITSAGQENDQWSPYQYVPADTTWTHDDSVTDPQRVLEAAIHDAWADWRYDRTAAELKRDKDQTAKEAQHKLDVTTTQRDYQNSLASNHLTWVQNVTPLRGDLYVGNITQEDYNMQKAQHGTTRDSGETAAGRTRADGVEKGDSTVNCLDDLLATTFHLHMESHNADGLTGTLIANLLRREGKLLAVSSDVL